MAMAMSCMNIGKAFSTVVSLPVRPISSPKTHFAVKSEISFTSHHFCTDAKKANLLDQKFVTVLKSEFNPSERLTAKNSMPPVPADFPFTIECDYSSINLKREFEGEKIDVSATLPGWEESTVDIAPSVCLRVEISKENGKLLTLEVSATSRDIRVTRVLVEERVPDSPYPRRFGCHNVKDGSDLQCALKEFIEVRGVEKKHFEFLYDYINKNDERRSVVKVERLEKFFEE